MGLELEVRGCGCVEHARNMALAAFLCNSKETHNTISQRSHDRVVGDCQRHHVVPMPMSAVIWDIRNVSVA